MDIPTDAQQRLRPLPEQRNGSGGAGQRRNTPLEKFPLPLGEPFIEVSRQEQFIPPTFRALESIVTVP